jgi:hypothetical protein
MVGLPYDDIKDKALIEEGSLEVFPTHYDASYSDSLVGFEYKATPDYSYLEIDFNPSRVDNLLANFKEITGQDGHVYLTTIGS